MASIERILNSGAKKCEENDGVGQGMDTLGHELDEWCLQWRWCDGCKWFGGWTKMSSAKDSPTVACLCFPVAVKCWQNMLHHRGCVVYMVRSDLHAEFKHYSSSTKNGDC